MKDSIFISGNTPSSKNNTIMLEDRNAIVASRATQRWRRQTRDQWKENRDVFHKMLEGLSPPFLIEFTFVRKQKRKFDYINPAQTVQDAMRQHGWIEDDDCDIIKPSFGDYKYDKNNPGVWIKVIKQKPIKNKSFMIYRNTKEKTKEYENCPYINQSLLKVLIEQGVEAFVETKASGGKSDKYYYEEKAHFLRGSAVDTYILFGKDVFESSYAISEMVRKPSETELSIIMQMFDLVTQGMVTDNENPDEYKPIYQYPEQAIVAMDNHSYYMNRHWSKKKDTTWMDDTRLQSLCKSGLAQEYWQELIKAKGKIVLSDADKVAILGMEDEEGKRLKHGSATSVLEHPFTSYLFKEEEGIDIVYQFECYFEEMGVMCKALLDMVRINHKSQTIYPIDLKTIGWSILKFNQSVSARRYDFQGSWYLNAIRKCLQELSNLIGVDVTNYRIADFAFVGESTVSPGTPLIFVMTPQLEAVGRRGDGRYKKGWTQALDLLRMWQEAHFSITEMFKADRGVLFLEETFDYNKVF